jgi:outer membrane immunogenic protein
MDMKKILLGTVGLIALGAVPASAADLAARPYTKAPPMIQAAVYDWTGFYIGGNAGWGNSHNSWNLLNLDGSTFGSEGSNNADGGFAGGQIGYRWQAGTWVFGVEAQGDWASFRGSNISTVFGDTNRSRLDAFGLFTGQIGYAWNNVLLYVKGGAAVVDNRYDVFSGVNGALIGSSSDNTNWGGTVGAGVEVGFAPNWTVGVEYDHIFLQDRTVDFTVPSSSFLLQSDRIRQDVDLVSVRLNYKFNWGAGAIAKY